MRQVLLVAIFRLAVQGIRVAGPALVDQDDIAIHLEAMECGHAILGQGGRAASRTAFEDEQRIRRGLRRNAGATTILRDI